jgi:hypothetical protein
MPPFLKELYHEMVFCNVLSFSLMKFHCKDCVIFVVNEALLAL